MLWWNLLWLLPVKWYGGKRNAKCVSAFEKPPGPGLEVGEDRKKKGKTNKKGDKIGEEERKVFKSCLFFFVFCLVVLSLGFVGLTVFDFGGEEMLSHSYRDCAAVLTRVYHW